MEEIVNLIATDSSAADISDRMKDMLFTKAAEKIDAQKANVALSMFDTSTPETVENTEDQE
jgi:hypothetical protein